MLGLKDPSQDKSRNKNQKNQNFNIYIINMWDEIGFRVLGESPLIKNSQWPDAT